MEDARPIPDHVTGHDTRRTLAEYFAQLCNDDGLCYSP